MRLREAQPEDVADLARLTEQLGYAASSAEIAERLTSLRKDAEQRLFVAVDVDDRVVAFLHARRMCSFVAPKSVEVAALIVDPAVRATGVGRALMARAERWAQAAGVTSVQLRSNVTRAGAHAFYERLGYTIVKTSHAFVKLLNDSPTSDS